MISAPALNILVPTDFSKDSDRALRFATSLGRKLGATLHILHVTTLHELPGTESSEDLIEMRPVLEIAEQAARDNLEEGASTVAVPEITVIKKSVRGINAWEPILEYSEHNSIGLIVMAMRSGGGLARFLLGSVTERILKFAPCPVLVIPRGASTSLDDEAMELSLKRVIFADDLTDKSHDALRKAVAWLSPFRPEIHLIHVVEAQVPAPYAMMGVDSIFKVDSDIRDRLTEMLDTRSSSMIPDDWKTSIVVREGRVHNEIPTYADEIDADFLIVAGESHTDLGERVMGGTIERIARHAHCAFLVI